MKKLLLPIFIGFLLTACQKEEVNLSASNSYTGDFQYHKLQIADLTTNDKDAEDAFINEQILFPIADAIKELLLKPEVQEAVFQKATEQSCQYITVHDLISLVKLKK